MAVDCATLESLLLRLVEAVGSARAFGPGVDEEGVKKLRGLLDLKLDQVITGLSLKPTHRRKKFKVLGLEYALDRESRPVVNEDLDPGLDHCVGSSVDPSLDPALIPGFIPVLDPGSNPDLVTGWDSGSNSGLDPGFDLASDLKLDSISWTLGSSSGLVLNQELSPEFFFRNPTLVWCCWWCFWCSL